MNFLVYTTFEATGRTSPRQALSCSLEYTIRASCILQQHLGCNTTRTVLCFVHGYCTGQ